MQQFHRFISSKQKSKKNYSQNFSFRNNQENKQYLHNEDQKYLMQEEEENLQEIQKQNQDNQQQNNESKSQQNDSADPLDAFMENLQADQKSKQKQTKSKSIHKTKIIHKSKNYLKNLKKEIPEQESQNQSNQQINHQNQELPQWSNQDQQNEQLIAKIYANKQQNKSQNSQDQQQYQKNQSQNQQFFQNDNQQLQNSQALLKKINKKNKIIQTLKPFDFTKIQLKDFQKDFYDQHQDIIRLTQQQVKAYRKEFQIKVFGDDIPKPIISFGHLELDQKMKKVILKEGFQKPTPIQAQALPIALKGRDMIGVAKTGSGKTLAYVWPMITHVGHQNESKRNQGPIGLVLAPTRQLCQQIYIQTNKYAKKYDIKISCILGGQNKHQQWKVLKAGVDILIASPGRLIQMIKKKATNMFRVTYLVLDEADKMLSLGFQQQIRSIVSQTRPDRQTLLFTATMKKAMQFLAFDILDSPIRINVGEENSANEDVKQQVVVFDEKQEKFQWFKSHLNQLMQQGKILIFCNQKDSCEQIRIYIQMNLYIKAMTLHGDKTQYQRTMIMNSFKNTNPQDKQNSSILIATDIAGRGIDVKGIKTVINFQCPKTIQAYIHRIGRAGRAGQTGTSISFLNKSQSSIKFAIQLIKIFQNSGYPVSKQLQDLACLDDFYRRKRISSKMGVSFAKGKDATKFLNQILKKQQMGNSRAGLGMNASVPGFNNERKNLNGPNFSSFTKESHYANSNEQQETDKNQMSIAQILAQRNISAQSLSISQLSKIIREQMMKKNKHSLASSKLKSHFIRSSQGILNKNTNNSFEKGTIDDQAMNQKGKQITVSFYKPRNN